MLKHEINKIQEYKKKWELKNIYFPIPCNINCAGKKQSTNLKQLPTKQKINCRTTITQELINSYKYTPEELELINYEKGIYYEFNEDANNIIDLKYDSDDSNARYYYKYTSNNAIVAINNSIYAIEVILERDNETAECYCSAITAEDKIIDILDDKYGYMLRILSNFKYYNDRTIYKIYGNNEIIKTCEDLNKFMKKIIGKSIKHCFDNFLLVAITNYWDQ